jgi:hypothetical protein
LKEKERGRGREKEGRRRGRGGGGGGRGFEMHQRVYTNLTYALVASSQYGSHNG